MAKKMGRPKHTINPALKDDVTEALLLDKFMAIQAFKDYRPEVYSREQMVSACMGCVLTGSNVKASQLSGVPVNTVKQWRYVSKWWPEAEGVAREILSDKIEDKFTGLLNETLNQLETRLSKGDVIHRDGATVNVPIKASELGRILAVLFDKRQLLKGDVTSRSETKTGSEHLDKLKKAAEEVVKQATSRIDDAETGT